MELHFKSSEIYKKITQSTKKIVVNEGGTRSSKTYSILQYLLCHSIEHRDKIISIVRKNYADLPFSSMKDFFDILTEQEIYNPINHDKTHHTYFFNGNEFQFLGLDKAEKKRGTKRDILYINEALDITLEDWRQLSMRTTERIFIDYNPSVTQHWLYDEVLTRDDCEVIHSTYKDNPFLLEEQIKEIERLITDPYYYNVYALGKRADIKGVIFDNWTNIKSIPIHEVDVTTGAVSVGKQMPLYDVIYGLDFGYQNPCALIEIRYHEKELWVKEKFYRTKMTNADIINEIKVMGIKDLIYADAAEPKSIAEIRSAGINILPTNKGADSVFAGIQFLKGFKVNVVDSPNIDRERRGYKWAEDKGGKKLEQPVKINDHALDAIRGAVHTHLYKGKSKSWLDNY